MRPITNITLHAALAAALIACSASSAAAMDRLKLLATVNMGATDAERGKEKWIEIQGWDWGRTAAIGGLAVKQRAATDDHEEEMTIVAGQAAAPPGGEAKYGAVGGMHRDSSRTGSVGGSDKQTIGGNHTPTAGKQNKLQELRARSVADIDQAPPPAEKRQHDWRPSPMAVERGAVRVKVKFPWIDCRPGARFPAATLDAGGKSYDLTGLTVASCEPDAIALNYAKVQVRGWNPEKKEE